MAEWKYPFPSRTRKSSALTPMVLHSCGRVGSRQVLFFVFLELCTVYCVVAFGPCVFALSLTYILVYGTNPCEILSQGIFKLSIFLEICKIWTIKCPFYFKCSKNGQSYCEKVFGTLWGSQHSASAQPAKK